MKLKASWSHKNVEDTWSFLALYPHQKILAQRTLVLRVVSLSMAMKPGHQSPIIFSTLWVHKCSSNLNNLIEASFTRLFLLTHPTFELHHSNSRTPQKILPPLSKTWPASSVELNLKSIISKFRKATKITPLILQTDLAHTPISST